MMGPTSRKVMATFILLMVVINEVTSWDSRFPVGRISRIKARHRGLNGERHEARERCMKYAPFNKKVIVGGVESPVVVAQNQYIKKYAGRGTLTANGAMHVLNVLKHAGSNISSTLSHAYKNTKIGLNFAKWAPFVASSLGVLGVGFGILIDLSQPSVQDAIDNTNKLFLKFAAEVSKSLERMKGFVKAELSNLEKRLMMEDFVAMTKELNACDEMHRDDIFTCVLRAFMNMRSQIEKFLKYEDRVLAGAFTKEHGDVVRQFEACFIAFNSYAFTYMKTVDMIARSYECGREFYQKDSSNKCDKKPNWEKEYEGKVKEEIYDFEEAACTDLQKSDYYLRLYSKLYLDSLKRFREYQNKGMEMMKAVHKINRCSATMRIDRKKVPYQGHKNPSKSYNENEYEVKCGCDLDPTFMVGDCTLRYFLKDEDGDSTNGYDGQDQRRNWQQICQYELTNIANDYHRNIENKIENTWEKNLVDLTEESWSCATRHRKKIIESIDTAAEKKEKKKIEEKQNESESGLGETNSDTEKDD